MYNKTYISGLSITGAISTLAWFMVALKLDPFESTALALALLFISLFFSSLCIFTLLGFYVSRFSDRGELYHYHMSISLRQGLLLAVCAMSLYPFLCLGCLLGGQDYFW